MAPQVNQNLLEMAPELHPDKGVQDGIEAAVEVGHTSGHRDGHQCHFFCLALPLLEEADGVVEQGHIVGQVADDKHDHHCQHHTHRLVPLEVLSPEQSSQDAGIAEAHDQQWEEEPHRYLRAGNQDFHQPCRVCVVVVKFEIALNNHLPIKVLLLVALIIDDSGCGQDER